MLEGMLLCCRGGCPLKAQMSSPSEWLHDEALYDKCLVFAYCATGFLRFESFFFFSEHPSPTMFRYFDKTIFLILLLRIYSFLLTSIC